MEGVVEGRWGCGGLEVVKIDGLLMLFGHKHEFSHYFFFTLKSIGEDRKKQKTLLIMRNDSASQGCGSGFQYWSD